MEVRKDIAPHVMACKKCEGKGRVFFPDRNGNVVASKCPVCEGSGRVKVQSRVVTRIEPFVPRQGRHGTAYDVILFTY